jgi:hypothetical protein
MRGNAIEDEYDDSEPSEEDEEDISFDINSPGEMPEEHFGYGASFNASEPFGKAELEFLQYISRSQYLPGVLERIRQMPVTEEYKKALVDEAASLLSPETVYANSRVITGTFGGTKLDEVKVKILDAKLRLRLTRCAASKADLRCVSASRIEGAILGVYVNYLSRSVGKDRERLIQEIASKSTNISETRIASEESVPTPRKKSFWGIGRK